MPLHEMISDISSIARIDPAAVSEAGLWVAPLLPPGEYNGYQDPAIIANVQAGCWMDREALEPLLADDATPAAAVVELVPSIPRALHKAIDAYPRSAIGPDGKGQPTPELSAAASGLGGTVVKVALAQPGEANTTVVPLDSEFESRGLRAGFHLDGRDRKSLAKRAESRRRFIPNRGPGGRIAAVCLPDIVTVGRILDFPEEQVPDYSIYREYLRANPEGAVCIGIPVRPGQGSLVNTDLVVHDGMTLGATQESMTFQILGHWERGELATKV